MAGTKTTATSVDAYLDKIPGEQRRKDCKALVKIMKRVTGEKPVLWGRRSSASADITTSTRADTRALRGRLTLEEEGPMPQWLRITEYVIDRNGDRTNLTPHHVAVQSGVRFVRERSAVSDRGCDAQPLIPFWPARFTGHAPQPGWS